MTTAAVDHDLSSDQDEGGRKRTFGAGRGLALLLVITGAAGNLLFGALGLLLSVPLLRRLYRRFGTWKAPTLALAAIAAMFSLSALVIGPALSGAELDATPTPPTSDAPEPGPRSTNVEHDAHHGD